LLIHSCLHARVNHEPGDVLAHMQEIQSLLAIGVTAVEGEFARGDVVACVDQHGVECGRGLINYSAADTRRIMRHPSNRIADILGSMSDPELMHRDNMVLLRTQTSATAATAEQ